MKHILYTFAIILLIASLSHSQTDSSCNALQFNFVNKTSLAYRYKLSNNSELRTGIDLSGSISDRRRYDVPVYYYGTDSLLFKFNEVRSSNYESIRLSTDYLYFFYRYEHVSLYSSAGPFIAIMRDEYYYTSRYSQNSEQITEGHSISFIWNFGAIFGVGVECRIYDFVSVLGEYSAVLGYGYEGSRPSSGPDYRVVTFNLEQLHIGVCIRF